MIILKKCAFCGQLFILKSNAEKYCSTHCKHEARLESKRKYMNNRNKRKNYNTRVKNLTELGSLGTHSTCHAKKDFDAEHRSIRSQMRMLRLS